MNETEYDSLLITIVGLVLTFGGLVLQGSSEKQMSHVSGVVASSVRDVGADNQDVELDLPDFTSR